MWFVLLVLDSPVRLPASSNLEHYVWLYTRPWKTFRQIENRKKRRGGFKYKNSRSQSNINFLHFCFVGLSHLQKILIIVQLSALVIWARVIHTFSAWFLIPDTLLFRQAMRASASWFLESKFPISTSLTPESETGLETGSSSRKLSSLN